MPMIMVYEMKIPMNMVWRYGSEYSLISLSGHQVVPLSFENVIM